MLATGFASTPSDMPTTTRRTSRPLAFNELNEFGRLWETRPSRPPMLRGPAWACHPHIAPFPPRHPGSQTHVQAQVLHHLRGQHRCWLGDFRLVHRGQRARGLAPEGVRQHLWLVHGRSHRSVPGERPYQPGPAQGVHHADAQQGFTHVIMALGANDHAAARGPTAFLADLTWVRGAVRGRRDRGAGQHPYAPAANGTTGANYNVSQSTNDLDLGYAAANGGQPLGRVSTRRTSRSAPGPTGRS